MKKEVVCLILCFSWPYMSARINGFCLFFWTMIFLRSQARSIAASPCKNLTATSESLQLQCFIKTQESRTTPCDVLLHSRDFDFLGQGETENTKTKSEELLSVTPAKTFTPDSTRTHFLYFGKINHYAAL